MPGGKRLPTAEHLEGVPPAVARSLLAAERLEPGAMAAVGRLFRIMGERGDPPDLPSRETFDIAAKSEPTLATLLRTLAVHAPRISLATGREARRAWYVARSQSETPRRRGPAPPPETAPAAWPLEWALLYPALLRARIRETSLRHYVAGINRSAAALAATDAAADWSRYSAYCIAERLAEEGVRPSTIASYLDGPIALAKHARLPDADLAGLREMREDAKSQARRLDKLKVGRLQALAARGGIVAIAETVGELRRRAAALSAWTAEAERLRQTAAILAIEMEAWARTGDVASWILGRDLVRLPCGTWRLGWTQTKTMGVRSPGDLSPEVGAVIDELVLAGRPPRFAALRYAELAGANWLTHGPAALASKQPSLLVRDAVDLPLHDLRTLIADEMRRIDPERAARLVPILLGHRDPRSSEEYRALCEGNAAADDWARLRSEIGGSSARASGHPA